MSKIAVSVAALLASALSGCVSITPVKDITADQTGYMQKKFSPSNLSPGVASKLPTEKRQLVSSQVTLSKESTSETSDKKIETWKSVETVTSLGNGLFQRKTESSNNDISYRISYALTYKGFFALRRQDVNLSAANAGTIFETKEIKRFDEIPNASNSESVLEYANGTEPQIVNFYQGKYVCKYLKTVPGKEIHKSISGNVIQLECNNIDNNSVQAKSQWAYLDSYGFATMTSYISSGKKTTITVLDFKG